MICNHLALPFRLVRVTGNPEDPWEDMSFRVFSVTLKSTVENSMVELQFIQRSNGPRFCPWGGTSFAKSDGNQKQLARGSHHLC